MPALAPPEFYLMDGLFHATPPSVLTPFHHSPYVEDWWLKRVSEADGVRQVTLKRDGFPVATLLYAKSSYLGVRMGLLPWTHEAPPRLLTNALTERMTKKQIRDAFSELVRKLPVGQSLMFTVNSREPYAEEIAAAFESNYFKMTTQSTFVQVPSDPPPLGRMNSRYRNIVNNADKKLELDRSMTAGAFIALYEKQLRERGEMNSYSDLNVAHDLIETGLQRGQVLIFAAREKAPPGAPTNPIEAAIAFTIGAIPSTDHNGVTTKGMFATWTTYGQGTHKGAVRWLNIEGMKYAQDPEHPMCYDADGARNQRQKELYGRDLAIPHEVFRYEFTRRTTISQVHNAVGRPIVRWARRILSPAS